MNHMQSEAPDQVYRWSVHEDLKHLADPATSNDGSSPPPDGWATHILTEDHHRFQADLSVPSRVSVADRIGSYQGRRRLSFFRGAEALAEVAKPYGAWNWTLVGGVPAKLPLSGGGAGFVDELREALSQHKVSFGLLRMHFGTGASAKTKLIYVHSVLQKAKAQKDKNNALSDSMHAALEKYGKFDLDFPVSQISECTDVNICQHLRRFQPGEARDLTVDNFRAGCEAFKKELEGQGGHGFDPEESFGAAAAGAALRAPMASARHDGAMIMDEPDPDDLNTKQWESIKPWKKGDAVQVWCNTKGIWLDDGQILLVLDESASYDGYKLPSGAMKVQYGSGKHFKWVLQHHASKFLKASERPLAPPPMMGEIFKETHGFVVEWHVRHAEINQGFMQWWSKQDDARDGIKPNAVAALLGLQMEIKDTVFSMSTASTMGVVYSFDSTTPEGIKRWTRALQKHAEYCENLRDFQKKKQVQKATNKAMEDMDANSEGDDGHLA